MASGAAIKAGEAYVSLFTDWSRMKAGLNSAEQFGKNWGGRMRSASTAIMGSGPASFVGNYLTNATAVTAGLGTLTVMFANAGSELADMSSRTGTSVESLSALKFAAGQTGANFAQLEGGIMKFGKNLSDAAAGEEAAVKQFDKWGLSAQKFQGLGLEEQLAIIAERMKSLSAEDRTAMAMDLFGKSGAALIPILGNGSSALSQMTDRARELGLVWSSETAGKADALGDRLDEMKLVGLSVAYALGEQLYPVVMGLSDIFFDASAGVKEWITDNPHLASGIALVSTAAVTAGIALAGVGIVLPAVISGITTLTALVASPIGIGVGILAIGTALEYETGLGAAAIDYLAESMRGLGDIGAIIPDVIGEGFGRISADASMLADASVTAFGGIVDAVSAGDLGLAGEIAMAGLNLAFVTGWSEAKDLWTVTTAWLEMRWADVTFGMASAWANMATIVGDVWNAAMSLIDDAMTAISHFVVDVQEAVGLISHDEWKDTRGTISDMRDKREEGRKSSEWDNSAKQAKAEKQAEIEKERDEVLAGRQGDVAAARVALEEKAAKAAKQIEDKIGDRNDAVKKVAAADEDGPKDQSKKTKSQGGDGAGDITISGLASSMTRAFGWLGEMKPTDKGPAPGQSMLPLPQNDPANAAAQNAQEMEKLRRYEAGLSNPNGPTPAAMKPPTDAAQNTQENEKLRRFEAGLSNLKQPTQAAMKQPTDNMNAELLTEIRDTLRSIDGRVASGSTMEA